MNFKKQNIYNPKSKEPFAISRSKIELFLECPRCFYLDLRLGVKRPSLPGWPLNIAVDQLLKNEFDLLRANGRRHELMEEIGIDAVPYNHPDLDKWRDNFQGVRYFHPETNLLIYGAIDDLWLSPERELIVVDFKATSTEKEITLEDPWKQRFKKQVEVYQWLLRQNGFPVSKTAYFVFANAGKNRPRFDGRLEFELSIISHEGDDSWIEPTVFAIKTCLDADEIPASNPECAYCNYRTAASTKEF